MVVEVQHHKTFVDNVNVSSAGYWLPRVEKAALIAGMVPQTRLLPLTDHFFHLASQEDRTSLSPTMLRMVADVRAACESLGYPCFLRTDMGSAKQDGPLAYRIDGPDAISSRLQRTFEDNVLKNMLPAWVMVRKWLPLKSAFVAFHGHPIAREQRFFATASRGTLCHHPYWTEEAIHFDPGLKDPMGGEPFRGETVEPSGWQAKLRALNRPLSHHQEAALSLAATVAAAACPDAPAWSVDFAQDENGVWHLIDMADARHSWHPSECTVWKREEALLQDNRPGGRETQGGSVRRRQHTPETVLVE